MTATLAQRAEPRSRIRGLLAGNVAARFGALGALAVATVLVARAGGPALVGAFTLLRVLPGLAGVLAAAGLPGAVPYFLAAHADDPRLRPTIVALTGAGAALATGGWLALTPLLYPVFFRSWTVALVVAASGVVFTQLFVSVGKALLQGGGDLPGANVAIIAEEAAFVPVYLGALAYGRGAGVLLFALAAKNILVGAGIAERLRRRGFGSGWKRPSVRLGRRICGYGMRGQLGGLLTLVNLRLDVAILGALAGPAVLGVYAVASKYAELLRVPGLAVNYVLYPSFAGSDAARARERTRALLGRAAGLNVLAAIPLAVAAGPVLPLVYGHAFTGAVRPAWILLAGLLGEGVAGLVSAYLYGVGRPGRNSWAMAVGVAVTVAGDLLLIPHFGAAGAAVASTCAYLATDVALLACFVQLKKARR